MPNMKKSDPMLAKQVKKDVKFLKEKAATKKSTPKPTAKPKTPTMPTKPKPAVGADKAARKKYGSSSHNNGYTN